MLPVLALIIKYVPAILAFKDIADVFKTEQGSDKPFYLSQRFWGVLIGGISVVASIVSGITFSPETIRGLSEAIPALIMAGSVIYGTVLAVKGYLDARRRAKA